MKTSTSVLPECESDFLLWLRSYATTRAILLDEGKFCTLALIDFENWSDPIEGAANFHFGGIQ